MSELLKNNLGLALSPYLRQHVDNPVHWQQWGPEAFAVARQRDVPVLLSIGYSSCHWCHVMAHESFDDADIATVMNNNFVCIKVDREERPDIDSVYMAATVAMTGQGGWPMTCFLTADAQPFYCGTYYPPQPRGAMPSFRQLLEAITLAWEERREEVEVSSSAITSELYKAATGLPESNSALSSSMLQACVALVLDDEDKDNGGFGGAPKFPPSVLLEGLLRYAEYTDSAEVLASVLRAAEAMARGGIYDQLEGGFSRYCVDAQWVVPHFEKMLYDNALLLRFYGHLARRTQSGLARRVATGTAQFIIGQLSATGGFASAFDADTEGIEGLTYSWTRAQLIEVLGELDGQWAAKIFGVTELGTCEHGTSTLQLREDPTDQERFDRLCSKLRSTRAQRPQPERDDKVVTAWNGLAITALAEAGAALDEPSWVQAAMQCAQQILESHVVHGRLRRTSLAGSLSQAPGVLEDYAGLSMGLLALYQATGQEHWLRSAENLLDLALVHFSDPDNMGGWFDTADDSEQLVVRPQDWVDGATPSGASAITEALLTASLLVSPAASVRYAQAAEASLARAAILIERAPRSAGHWLAVAVAAEHGPLQIAIATDNKNSELLSAARTYAPGGTVVLAGAPNSSVLLANRTMIGGIDTAYLCRGFVCDMPRTDVAELLEALKNKGSLTEVADN
ncbi:MAG: thioredoxin domain-containing protein [Mycobacteriaceae bacterium]